MIIFGVFMKKFILLILFLTSFFSYAEIVISKDESNKCTLFRATSDEKPIENGENILFAQDVYGMVTKNLEIDFKNQKALIDLEASIVLGFNKKITNQRIQIQATHPEFKSFINTINKKIFQLETICLNNNNEVIYYSIGDKTK